MSEHDVLLDEDLEGGPETVSEFVSRLQFGRFHIRLLMACGCGWLIDQMWHDNVKFVLPFIQREFGLTAFMASFLIITQWISSAIGGVFWGVLSDRIGRRLSFMLSLILTGLFGFATGFTPHVSVLFIGMFCLFFMAGGNLPIDGAMFAEFMPAVVRGPTMVVLSTFWSIGAMCAGIICWLILPYYSCKDPENCNPEDNYGWRIIFMATGLLNLSFALVRIGLPESVKFLELKNKQKKALEVVHQIIKTNKSSVKVPDNLVFEHTKPAKKSQQSARKIMCGPKFRRSTIVLAIGWTAAWCGMACINTFLPELFIRKGFSLGDTYRNTFIYVSVGVISTICGSFLVESCLGRKWTLVLSSFTSGSMMTIFVFAEQEWQVILFSALLNFSNYIFFAAIYTYTPEVYPTVIRTTSASFFHMTARTGSVFAVIYAGLMVDFHLVDVLLYTGSGCMFLAGIAFVFLDIRTKGRILE